MANVNLVIENLAEAFCLLSNREHKDMYVAALHSVVRLAKSELLLEMQRDFEQATDVRKALAED
ncbi:MAG TPA: hypothetical protein VEC35_09655 [Noviherbaspirillum sp.]|nr:hypothetical protein [Noviherbaspirillum sp.]